MIFSIQPFAVRSAVALLFCGLLALAASPGNASLVTGRNAYWDFNEPSGTTAANSGAGGSALDGILLEDAIFAPGLFGNAVSLPGRPVDYVQGDPTSYVNVGNQVIANGQPAYTISTWFNTPEAGSRRQVLFESGPQYALSAGLTSARRVEHYVQASNTGNSATNFTATQNQWHHLAITYDYDSGANQGTSKIYIDGVEYAGNQLVTTGVLGSTTYFRIGQHRYQYGEHQSFNGRIDDMAIWNRTLSASEISAIANLGQLSGIDLGNSAVIDNVLALSAVGQSATAGSDTWYYANALPAAADGSNVAVGRSYVGADRHRYIVLDGNAQDGFTGVATFGAGTRCLSYYPMQTDNGAPVSAGHVAARVDDAFVPAPWVPHGGPYHGTPQNGPTYSAEAPATIIGLDGQHTTRSLAFDGVNDYVDLGTAQELRDLPQGPFTVEAWIKTDDTSRGNIMGSYQSGTPRGFNLEILNGKLRAYFQGLDENNQSISPVDIRGNGVVNDGEWRHVAMVYTGPGTNNVQLYIDGQLDRQATYGGAGFSIDPSTPLRIGNDNRASSPIQYDGLMDQVRISGEAIVPGQFLIAGRGEQNYYRMETNGGSPVTVGPATTIDDTGLHPFTYNGAPLGTGGSTPAYSTDVPDRLIVRDGVELENKYSLSFNGAGDYVELGNMTLLKTLPEDDFTIEFFMKTDAAPAARYLVLGSYTGSGATAAMNIELFTNGRIRAYLNSGDNATNDLYLNVGADNLFDDEWHHVALVRSGAGTVEDTLELFFDYETTNSRAVTLGQFSLESTLFRLGRDARTDFYYKGLLDEFRITRGALDVSQFLVAVPEPGTFGLLLTGLLILLAAGRRRK